MSYLKDAKIIKAIAENESSFEPSEEACRYILSQAELFLRRLIIESARIAKRFTRTQLRAEDIQISLDHMNMSYLAIGSSSTTANTYLKSDNSGYELDKTGQSIKERMIEIIKTKMVKKRKTELSLDWLFIKGKLNLRVDGQASSEKTRGSQAVVERNRKNGPEAFEEFANYDFFTQRNMRPTYLIKEVNPDVLTREAGNFFETFRSIVEEYFSKLDSSIAKIDFRRFNYGWLISVVGGEESRENAGAVAAVCVLHPAIPRELTRTNR